jgi:hypothetical protein
MLLSIGRKINGKIASFASSLLYLSSSSLLYWQLIEVDKDVTKQVSSAVPIYTYNKCVGLNYS